MPYFYLLDLIAPQCKAGLGRTGTLIGAYLIWKYGFTANEAIAFMRIIRPGSVVGPQQQYMYLKQLEWVKWSASDEIRKAQASVSTPPPTAREAVVAVRTPATPPAESDEERNAARATPPRTTVRLPPVTPSRHVATATAKAGEIEPPGQPRKTPKAKRVAVDSDDEEEEGDVLPALGIAPVTRAVKAPPARSQTVSEQRPSRVTRSTASTTVGKKAVANPPPPSSPVKSSRQGPNKIPRLATTRTTGAAAKALAASNQSPQTRSATKNPQPIPTSRLPTLKKQVSSSLADVANAKQKGSDAWVAKNPAAVVVPATKSQRPGLRPVRRRRSSFSNADVVA